MYDVTDKESFNNVQGWFSEIDKYASDNVNKIIVGNKCDLEDSRAVSTEEGQLLASSLGVQFLETSAKNSSNVPEAFNTMAQEIKGKIASNARAYNKPRTEKKLVGNPISPKKSSCC